MKIQFTAPAKASLRRILEWNRLHNSSQYARKIRDSIMKKIKPLKDGPFLGQEEEQLKAYRAGHRYLVQGHYKIIYRAVGNIIYVTDIFDTRQDPRKMKP